VEATKSHNIPFKASGHMITEQLNTYVRDLLANGTLTKKQVAEFTLSIHLNKVLSL
jgi:hypothetical protein